jgi:hypothetical protein
MLGGCGKKKFAHLNRKREEGKEKNIIGDKKEIKKCKCGSQKEPCNRRGCKCRR